MATRLALIGQRFGKLLVIAEAEPYINPQGRKTASRWICQCDCGGTTISIGGNLKKGNSTSCGCQKGWHGHGAITHGHWLHGKASPEWRSWYNMRQRVSNVSNTNYLYYGGRGITICERWSQFENFLADMGPKPSPQYSIERVNNNGNYEPGNCIWATRKVQASNRRNSRYIQYKGEQMTIAEAARRSGIPKPTLWKRVNTWPESDWFKST